jgi:hypothetical protein
MLIQIIHMLGVYAIVQISDAQPAQAYTARKLCIKFHAYDEYTNNKNIRRISITDIYSRVLSV